MPPTCSRPSLPRARLPNPEAPAPLSASPFGVPHPQIPDRPGEKRLMPPAPAMPRVLAGALVAAEVRAPGGFLVHLAAALISTGDSSVSPAMMHTSAAERGQFASYLHSFLVALFVCPTRPPVALASHRVYVQFHSCLLLNSLRTANVRVHRWR